MTRKKEQARMRELLTEALSVLCKASLTYQHEFNIEGLVGITVDNEEIFLVNINECVQKKTDASDGKKTDGNLDVSPGKRKAECPAEITPGVSTRRQDQHKKRARRSSGDPDVKVKVENETEEAPQREVDRTDGRVLNVSHDDDDDNYDAGMDDVHDSDDIKPGCSSWNQSVESVSQDSAQDCITVKVEPPDPPPDDVSNVNSANITGWSDPHAVPVTMVRSAGPSEKTPPKTPTLEHPPLHGHLECSECGKRYRTLTGLKDHIALRHHGETRYQCETCGKQFQSKTFFRAHVLLHSQKKEHVCDICNRSYCYKTTLLRHQEEKHGDRAGLCCEHCGKTSSSRSSLQRHIQTIHQGKRFICPICNDPFTTRSNWLRHCKNKHQMNVLTHFEPIVYQKNVFLTPVNQVKDKIKKSERTTFSEKKDVEGHEAGSCEKAAVAGEEEGCEECNVGSSSPEESRADKLDTGIMIALEFD